MNECKRILHVLHSVNCGGTETLLMNIYRRINRSEYQFDFLVNRFDTMHYEEEIEALGGKLFRMKFLTQVSPPIYARRLKRFFLQHPEYQVVHSHLETTTGLILHAAETAGVPVRIAHSHNTRYPRTGVAAWPENAYKKYCKTLIVPHSTHLFACSSAAATWLFGDADKRATIIKNGTDTHRFAFQPELRREVRNALGIAETTVVYGHVGRFYDQKNHFFLIEAFERCVRRRPDSLLMAVGDGELRNTVENEVRKKRLTDRVLFLGIRDDVDRLMQAMDVFVLPSKFEGLPLVIVEAQAVGLPCLVSSAIESEADMGGVVHFLPVDDASGWAQAMTEVCLKRCPITDRIKANGYDIRDTTRRLEEFYCEMYADSR